MSSCSKSIEKRSLEASEGVSRRTMAHHWIVTSARSHDCSPNLSNTDHLPTTRTLPQYQQAKNRINSQLSAIRQQLAMIEAYDMDGWKGARYGGRFGNRSPHQHPEFSDRDERRVVFERFLHLID
tara:strand:- start:841 stop:1215 length:375 start_codon:yes stop_codon:yes gene_type:complete